MPSERFTGASHFDRWNRLNQRAEALRCGRLIVRFRHITAPAPPCSPTTTISLRARWLLVMHTVPLSGLSPPSRLPSQACLHLRRGPATLILPARDTGACIPLTRWTRRNSSLSVVLRLVLPVLDYDLALVCPCPSMTALLPDWPPHVLTLCSVSIFVLSRHVKLLPIFSCVARQHALHAMHRQF